MAKEPEARYPTAGEFVQALEAALDSNPTAVDTAAVDCLDPATGPDARPGPVPTRAGRRPRVRAATARPPGPATGRRASRPATGAPSRSGTGAVPRPVPAGNGRAPRRTAALAALAVVLLGVILLISQLEGSGTPRPAASTGAARSAATARHRTQAHPRPDLGGRQLAERDDQPRPSCTSADPVDGLGPGHQRLGAPAPGPPGVLAHSYPAAISTLHKALAAASPGSLTYAYALYDLGVALLQSGNPQAAVPVLSSA